MGNTITINPNPSKKAKELAVKSTLEARTKKIEDMGAEKVRKDQEVIAQIGEVLQTPETSKNERTAQRSNDEITK